MLLLEDDLWCKIHRRRVTLLSKHINKTLSFCLILKYKYEIWICHYIPKTEEQLKRILKGNGLQVWYAR